MDAAGAQMGLLFGLQAFSLDDGPGIRTAVFLKGCGLRCAWCHNPESLSPDPELLYRAHLCTHCGACAGRCPRGVHGFLQDAHAINRSVCGACGACAEACPSGALAIAGIYRSVDEVMAQVLRDARYYAASGGGLSVSGGEPMTQFSFTAALLSEARRAGISTALETNGHAPFSQYAALLRSLDLILFDYKLTDDTRHQAYTGCSNRGILDTLSRLLQSGTPIVLRCPIIPGVNDTPDHFAAIASLSRAGGPMLGFELMPYHRLGTAKAQQLGGVQQAFEEPDPRTIGAWRDAVLAQGGVEWGCQ